MTETAPFDVALANGPPGERVVWLRTPDGVRIRACAWTGGNKGTVLLMPGRTEYIEKYGRAAGDLVARGWSVVSLDWRGQGLADRALPDAMAGHVLDFDEYQRDLDTVMDWARAGGLPGPWMLMAHSMGGAIGLRSLYRDLGFRAAAFSAPMWGIAMQPWQRPVAPFLTGLAGRLGRGLRYAPGTGPLSYVATSAFKGNTLTGDRGMWDYMRAQVLAHPEMGLGGPTMLWLRAALRECRALMRMKPPATPALTVLGTQEKVVDPAPVHLRMAAWGNGQLDLYPGAEHEIMMEGPSTRKRFFDSASALYDAQRR